MYNHSSVWLCPGVCSVDNAHTYRGGTAHHLPLRLTILIDIIRDRFSLFSLFASHHFLLGTEESINVHRSKMNSQVLEVYTP